MINIRCWTCLLVRYKVEVCQDHFSRSSVLDTSIKFSRCEGTELESNNVVYKKAYRDSQDPFKANNIKYMKQNVIIV